MIHKEMLGSIVSGAALFDDSCAHQNLVSNCLRTRLSLWWLPTTLTQLNWWCGYPRFAARWVCHTASWRASRAWGRWSITPSNQHSLYLQYGYFDPHGLDGLRSYSVQVIFWWRGSVCFWTDSSREDRYSFVFDLGEERGQTRILQDHWSREGTVF